MKTKEAPAATAVSRITSEVDKHSGGPISRS